LNSSTQLAQTVGACRSTTNAYSVSGCHLASYGTCATLRHG
jgi:hypothetical protein